MSSHELSPAWSAETLAPAMGLKVQLVNSSLFPLSPAQQTLAGFDFALTADGAGGTLLGYDVAPERQGSTIVWSEERQPEGAATSVFDCHALRLARKGVLEFSIVGADAKAAKSCTDELRALATAVRFDASSDYPAQIQGERVAVYSLVGLITQTQ